MTWPRYLCARRKFSNGCILSLSWNSREEKCGNHRESRETVSLGAQRACPRHALANSEHGSALQQPYLPLTMDEGQRHQIKKDSTAVFSQALALPEF